MFHVSMLLFAKSKINEPAWMDEGVLCFGLDCFPRASQSLVAIANI